MSSTHNIDLLGHAIPALQDLPRDKQLTSFEDLIGHSVRWIFSDDDCPQDMVVIATESGCFLAMSVSDGREICPVSPWGSEASISSYVKADSLARRGLMGQKAAAEAKRLDELKRIEGLRKLAAMSRQNAQRNLDSASRDEKLALELEAAMAAEQDGLKQA